MRFTLKDDEYWVKSDNQNDAFQKLGQLEDIEEKHSVKSTGDLDKRLRALEIIKEKKVYPSFLLNTKNLKEYNHEIIQKLTQEEYDLLKEVLK